MRDDLLTPIPGDNPAGVDLRHELYPIVRRAWYQEIGVPAPGWDLHRKTAAWALVAKETSHALATRSKDIQLAVWLVEATYHLESFEGFASAVRMTAQLLERFWDHLYPPLEDGNSEARITPLAWLGSDQHRLSQEIRLAPITTNGLTIFEFRDTRTVSFPWTTKDHDETQAGPKKIQSTKTSREDFEQAVNATADRSASALSERCDM